MPRWTRRVERSLLCAAAAPLSGVPAAVKMSVGTETNADGDTLSFLVGRAGLRRWLLALGEAQAHMYVTRGETCWTWLAGEQRRAKRHVIRLRQSPVRVAPAPCHAAETL